MPNEIPPTADGPKRVAGSFRDPAAFVFQRDGRIYRQINECYQPHYDHLIGSGLYDKLVAEHLLISHDEVAEPALESDAAYRILAPEQVRLISYPYEWCFSQLKQAALATLKAQRIALEHGMSLKDASAFNVQFVRGRALLVDTSSFELRERDTPWVAYQQFCRHFLAPLALISFVDARLMLASRNHLDGVPLELATRLLPFRSRIKFGLLMHLFAHAAAQRGAAGGKDRRDHRTFGPNAMKGLIDSLESTVSSLSWSPKGEWASYYCDTNYSDEAFGAKKRLVAELATEFHPEIVWDLGANTGPFSRLVAGSASKPFVVSLDMDPGAVEMNYQICQREGSRNVLPLVMDLANPSANLGWAGEERQSLQERGPADMLLALALVHHLAIGNNVPLVDVAKFLSRLASRLVVEFVPKSDSQVQRMLATRHDVFDQYDRPGFESAFSTCFQIGRCKQVPETDRLLYSMQRRG